MPRPPCLCEALLGRAAEIQAWERKRKSSAIETPRSRCVSWSSPLFYLDVEVGHQSHGVVNDDGCSPRVLFRSLPNFEAEFLVVPHQTIPRFTIRYDIIRRYPRK